MPTPAEERAPAPAWYADKGVELMHSCVCVAADLDKKRLTLRTYAPGDYGGATTIELSYEKLLIATGARPTRLDGATPSKDAMLASLWPTVHADVKARRARDI